MAAPESWLSIERVSDPEAGMPPPMALARLAMPTLNMSWFTSARSPVREASVLAISVFSNEARKAIASATPSSPERSSKMPSRQMVGSRGAKSPKPNDTNVSAPLNTGGPK